MNKVILMGRLTRDPEVRYSAGDNSMAIARYTLAVDRRFKRDGEATADFIGCVAFGRSAEFAEKYFRQGLKVVVSGRIQTAETLIHPNNCQTSHRKDREQITIILLTKIRNCQQPSSENRVDDSHADTY